LDLVRGQSTQQATASPRPRTPTQPTNLSHPQGVSENIMLGQLCPLGTGAFDLLLNEDQLEEATDLLALET